MSALGFTEISQESTLEIRVFQSFLVQNRGAQDDLRGRSGH